MTRLFFLGMIFLLSAPLLRAQKPAELANNIVYGEALGIGGFYSLNYERVLLRAFRQRMMITAAVGASGYSRPKDFQSFFFLERLNVAFGYKCFYFEIGADLVLDRDRSYSYKYHWMLWNDHGTLFSHFGLRFQKKGWPFAKAYVFPIHNDAYNDFFLYQIDKPWHGPEWYWWWGLSLGYAF